MTKTKFPLVTLFFIIALITSTIIRFLQYETVIRIDNGFFEYGMGFINNAYYIFFAIFAGGAAILTFVDRKRKCGILSRRGLKTPSSYKFSSLTAVLGIIIFTVCGGLVFLNTFAVLSYKDGDITVIMKIIMCLTVLCYTYIGYAVVAKRAIKPLFAIALLVIAGHCVGVAVEEFTQRVYTIHLTARLIELSSNILLALFFLSCGRIIARSETRFTTLFATVTGYSAVLLIFSDGLSRLFYYYGSNPEMQNALVVGDNGFFLPLPLFFAQGFAVLWLLLALSDRKYSIDNEEENEEIETFESLRVPETPEDIELAEGFKNTDNGVLPDNQF
ncbi:MAG: hypothetical protein FWF94_07150 [Oscillospiraceae bacterium]|nr:hypothetical protein [Oscillospiraceae bacterium]